MTRRTLILFVSYFLFLGASPIVNVLPFKTIFVIGLIFICNLFFRSVIGRDLFIFSIVYLFTNLITSLYHETLVPLIYSTSYLIVLYLARELYLLDIEYFIRRLSFLFILLLLFAFVSFIYFNLGGPPLFSLKNSDGRDAFFYLTSFNTGDETIRPTGIYDEPGAFSFFICLLVTFRDLLSKSKDKSLLILIFGFITQSLTHIIFFSIYLFNYLFLLVSFRAKNLIKFIIVFFLILSLSFYVLRSEFSEYTKNRTEKYVSDPNSTGRILSQKLIFDEFSSDRKKILFGLNKATAERDNIYLNENDYGENFLTPLVYGGILSSWPYYFFILYLLYFFLFIKRIFSLVGCIVLLIQRPYFLELPYSFPLSVLCIALLYFDKSKALLKTN